MFAIGLLATILAILLICAIRPIAAPASPLTTEELRFLCPEERDFCHEHSKQGFCYGKSIKVGKILRFELNPIPNIIKNRHFPTTACK